MNFFVVVHTCSFREGLGLAHLISLLLSVCFCYDQNKNSQENYKLTCLDGGVDVTLNWINVFFTFAHSRFLQINFRNIHTVWYFSWNLKEKYHKKEKKKMTHFDKCICTLKWIMSRSRIKYVCKNKYLTIFLKIFY